MKDSIIAILYLGVTNSMVNKNDKKEEKKNKLKKKDSVKDNKNINKGHKNDNKYKNIKYKEEKILHDDKIIKTLPPIPEAGLLALQVIYDNNNDINDINATNNDNDINDNCEKIKK